MVFNLSLHYVQQIEDAEEITQDVFLKVHESLDKFREDSSIKTWIYRITVNRSLDFIKAKNRKKRLKFMDVFFKSGEQKTVEPSEFNHPGVQLENKEEMNRLFQCINTLPEHQKSAIILSKIEGRPIKEIAEIIGKSPKAVESLIQRATLNLNKTFNQSEG